MTTPGIVAIAGVDDIVINSTVSPIHTSPYELIIYQDSKIGTSRVIDEVINKFLLIL